MNDVARGFNAQCADRLREAADLLEAQNANPFRVSAYRKAAGTVLALDQDVAAIVARDGLPGLEALPSIGRGIAAALLEMTRTGRWIQLERLRGNADPVQLLTAVPGLGHRLAERIHEELHVDTLEALELAAHDGRLESVPGVGPRRAAAIRASLQAMLSRSRPRLAVHGAAPRRARIPAGRRAQPARAPRAYRRAAPRGCARRVGARGPAPRSATAPDRRCRAAARAASSVPCGSSRAARRRCRGPRSAAPRAPAGPRDR